MPLTLEAFGIDKLTDEERYSLLPLLEAAVTEERKSVVISPELAEELRRREEEYLANPHDVLLWEDVLAELRRKLKR